MKARLIGGEHNGTVLDVGEGVPHIQLARPLPPTILNDYSRDMPKSIDATLDVYRLVRLHFVRHRGIDRLTEGVYCPATWEDNELFSWLLLNQ